MALYSNLIGHNLEKFGMVTVLDATFYDVVSGAPLIHFDTLKMSNISSEGQQKEIRGGQGAELLLTYDFGRTANIEITDALASMYSLQYLWGGTLSATDFPYLTKKGSIVISSTTIALGSQTLSAAAGSGSSFTASMTLTPGHTVQVGDILTAASGFPTAGYATVLSVAATGCVLGATTTFTNGSVSPTILAYQTAIGTTMSDLYEKNLTTTNFWALVDNATIEFKVTVADTTAVGKIRDYAKRTATSTSTVYYKKLADIDNVHTHQLTLTSTDFPPIVKLVGDTFLLDQSSGQKIAMQIEIPRFKLDANFSFTLESEGDASVFDFSGVALSDNGNIIIMRTLGSI